MFFKFGRKIRLKVIHRRRTADYWRERGAEARLFAEKMADDDRRKMLEIASICDHLAEQEERRSISRSTSGRAIKDPMDRRRASGLTPRSETLTKSTNLNVVLQTNEPDHLGKPLESREADHGHRELLPRL